MKILGEWGISRSLEGNPLMMGYRIQSLSAVTQNIIFFGIGKNVIAICSASLDKYQGPCQSFLGGFFFFLYYTELKSVHGLTGQ